MPSPPLTWDNLEEKLEKINFQNEKELKNFLIEKLKIDPSKVDYTLETIAKRRAFKFHKKWLRGELDDRKVNGEGIDGEYISSLIFDYSFISFAKKDAFGFAWSMKK